MKLQPDKFDVPAVTGQGAGWIALDGERIDHSVIIGANGERQNWDCSRFEDLTPEHFARLAAFPAELVLFGSGRRCRFPPVAWLRPLVAKQIGLETMDTAAACRTYNILVGEGRRVVAALLLEGPADTPNSA